MAAEKKCCVPSCGLDTEILHKFPHPEKDADRFWTWISKVGGNILTVDNMYVYNYRRICHRHFEAKYRTWSKYLSINAVPTLHLSGDLPLHRFPDPSKFPDIFKKWVEIAGGKLESREDYTFYWKKKIICDRHFTDKDRSRFKRLNALAVPSLGVPCTSKYAARSSTSTLESRPERIDKPEPSPSTCVPPGVRQSTVTFAVTDHSYCRPRREGPEYIRPSTSEATVMRDYISPHDDISPQDDIPADDNVTTQERIFSWQRDDAVVPCDEELEIMEVDQEKVPETESQVAGPTSAASRVHADIHCNACQKEIVGFRYICVQCVDYDLCSGCEARGLHHSHYVLRVPGPRPQSEIQEMLQTIRQALIKSIIQLEVATDGTVVEVKDEEEDPLVGEQPPPSPSLPHYTQDDLDHTPNYPRNTPAYPDHTPNYPRNTPNYPDHTPYYPDNTPNYAGNTPNYPDHPQDDPDHTENDHNFTFDLNHTEDPLLNKSGESEANSGTHDPYDPPNLAQTFKKRTTEPLDPKPLRALQYFSNFNSMRTKKQTSGNVTKVNRTEEKSLESQEKESETIISIEVIDSEPIDPNITKTAPPLEEEFLTSLQKLPEIVNARTREYTLLLKHMNCNYYIQVKKMTREDRNKQLVKKYCGDKISCVHLTRLTSKEISAATDQQRTRSRRNLNTAKRNTP